MKRLSFAILSLFLSLPVSALANELTPLKYNNPGLIVDLGVGLWAWPIPCDADNDGDFDLIVSCPDKPSNGVWLFENGTGDTAQNKMPVFAPGHEYFGFTTTGLTGKRKLSIAVNFHRPLGTQHKGPNSA